MSLLPLITPAVFYWQVYLPRVLNPKSPASASQGSNLHQSYGTSEGSPVYSPVESDSWFSAFWIGSVCSREVASLNCCSHSLHKSRQRLCGSREKNKGLLRFKLKGSSSKVSKRWERWEKSAFFFLYHLVYSVGSFLSCTCSTVPMWHLTLCSFKYPVDLWEVFFFHQESFLLHLHFYFVQWWVKLWEKLFFSLVNVNCNFAILYFIVAKGARYTVKKMRFLGVNWNN